MISNLINSHDICFFIEHWLGAEEAHYFNEIIDKHSIIFSADFERSTLKKGRPFGGTCWVISDSFKICEKTTLSSSVSKIVIDGQNIDKTTIFGLWQPFDDGSQNKLALLQSTISLLEIEIENLNGQDYVIMRDFNADFNRSNRFDLLFKQLLIKLNMFDLAYSYECDLTPTYAKGTYSSTIDHIWVSDHMIHKIIDFKIVSHPADASDHRPISCQIRSVSTNIDYKTLLLRIREDIDFHGNLTSSERNMRMILIKKFNHCQKSVIIFQHAHIFKTFILNYQD